MPKSKVKATDLSEEEQGAALLAISLVEMGLKVDESCQGSMSMYLFLKKKGLVEEFVADKEVQQQAKEYLNKAVTEVQSEGSASEEVSIP